MVYAVRLSMWVALLIAATSLGTSASGSSALSNTVFKTLLHTGNWNTKADDDATQRHERLSLDFVKSLIEPYRQQPRTSPISGSSRCSLR